MAADYECENLELSSEDLSAPDPRIRIELEALNAAADCINKLENELQASQMKFIRDKRVYTQTLDAKCRKIGPRHISKSQPYYELVGRSLKVQTEACRSAEKYHRACIACDRAKQALISIEQQTLTNVTATGFSADQQEALNKATAEFTNAEKEKSKCETAHQKKTAEYLALQQRLTGLLKEFPKSIDRARHFYDLKEQLESQLQTVKQNAEDVALALNCSKQRYQMALASLESISDEVHEQRRLVLPPRTPGVGAEAVNEPADWPSVNIDVDLMTGAWPKQFDAESSSCCSSNASDIIDMGPQMSQNGEPLSQEVVKREGESNVLQNEVEQRNRTMFKSETVTCNAENLCRDDEQRDWAERQIDGAEDNMEISAVEECSASRSELAVPEQNVYSSDGIKEAGLTENDLSQAKSVPVSCLPSGVYIAKSSEPVMDDTAPAADVQSSAGAATVTLDANDSTRQRKFHRRLRVQQQFPILQNLKATHQWMVPPRQ